MRKKRVLVLLAAAVAVAAVTGVVIMNLGVQPSKGATVSAPPVWLRQQASKALSNPSYQIQSVTWSATTVGAYLAWSGQGGSTSAFPSKPVDVVVANGDFPHVYGGGGKQLILEYGDATHQLVVVETRRTPMDASKLGTVQPLSLR